MVKENDMIDVGMVEAAVNPSKTIRTVENSWREYVTRLKNSIVRLPFPGEYTAIIGTNFTLIEGYTGELIIDRVADGTTTYLLTKPLRCKDYRVYAYYTKTGQFQGFTSRPVVGFHYTKLNKDGDRRLCNGNLEYTSPTTVEAVRRICKRIVQSRRVIYIGSLGSCFAPHGYKGLQNILENESSWGERKRKLIDEGYMKPILETEEVPCPLL